MKLIKSLAEPSTKSKAPPFMKHLSPDEFQEPEHTVNKPKAPSFIKAPAVEPEVQKYAPTINGGLVKTWSPTGLFQFEECEYRVYLKRYKKIKEESGEAAERGTKIHDLAENYVNGSIEELPAALKKFESRFELLKDDFEAGKVELEQDWGFTTQWEPTDVDYTDPGFWGIMKLDAFVREDNSSAIVIDHKTGRKFGNEYKHNRQGMMYAIGAFMRYPEVDFIRTEFWYLDKGEDLTNSYTRDQAMVLLPRVTDKLAKLTSCLDFEPKPSMQACKWCPHGKSGACEYGA